MKTQAKKAKPATKSVGKTAPNKAVSKAALKPTKVTSPKAKKPVAKPLAKSVIKAKAPAKKVVKPVVKPKAAPAKKAVSAKPVKVSPSAKAVKVLKPVKPLKAVAAKKIVKSVIKKITKSAEKVAPKKAPTQSSVQIKKKSVSSSVEQNKKTIKLAPTPKVVPPKAVEKTSKVYVVAATPKAPDLAPAPSSVQPVVMRSTRKGSKAGATVFVAPIPTHSPDAAKASYSVRVERLVTPPLTIPVKKNPKLVNNWKTKAGEALTDEEVVAMPDSEYMNDKQLAFFRHKLQLLKQEIHTSAGETTEHLREDTVVVPDPADRATIEEEHALELRTRDRERKLLRKIEQSIGRIDSGDYGYCDETGEPIGVSRLIARPTATLSLEAQQRSELKKKMFGD